MVTGTVKWWNEEKGYGFITTDDDAKDIFVHVSAVERSGLKTLTDGQKLSFTREPGRDGRESAMNLKQLFLTEEPLVTALPKVRSNNGKAIGSSAGEAQDRSLDDDEHYRSVTVRTMRFTFYATVVGVILTAIGLVI